MRAGCVSAAATGAFPTLATGGGRPTPPQTSPARLPPATPNTNGRNDRAHRHPQLADPAAVGGAPDEGAVAVVARHVQELLLRDERAKRGEVRVRAVPHDAANTPRQLTPLPFRQRLAVTGDGDQERRRGARDRLREELVRLGPGDDLAACADD